MEETKSQKEKLARIIEETGKSIDQDAARKIGFKQFERVCRRLIQYFDECKECQEYTDLIIKYAQDTNNFISLGSKQELLDFHRNIKAVVSHMQNKHKLITEGYYMSLYMSIGLALGAGLGAAFKNVAIGISIGMCIGLAIGSTVDGDYRKKGLVI